MPGMKKRLPLILAVLLASAAGAQDDKALPEGEEEEIRRYTVEMIIFKYNEDVSIGTEVFVPDPPPEPVDDLIFEDELDIVEESEPLPEEEPEVLDEEDARKYAFVMLTEDELTMLETWEHLDRLDVYEPVMHFGWTQPTLTEEETEARPLSSFATPPDGLDGDLKLYLGRYLHLVVDLALDAPETMVTEYYEYRDADGTLIVDMLDREAEQQPTHYRIQEDRIFKSGDVRYFDHPKFGVLTKITRFEEEEEPEDEFEEFLGDPGLIGG